MAVPSSGAQTAADGRGEPDASSGAVTGADPERPGAVRAPGTTPVGAPRRLWVVVVLQSALMLAVMVLYPAFQQPDEAAHVDYVLAHRSGDWFVDPGQRRYQSGVQAAAALVPDTALQVHIGDEPVVARADRDSFDELGTAPSAQPITNQMVQHPPLYYAAAAGFSYLLPSFTDRNFDVQVFWLRLFSLLLMAPVPLLIFGTARRFLDDPNLCLVATAIPLSIPSYLRAGASVSNDALLILTCTGLIALLARLAAGDLTRRAAVAGGLWWGAALLVKGFALAMPPAILLACLVGARGPFGQRLRQALSPALVAGGIGALIGGWWWVRNLIRYGTVQPAGLGELPDSLRQQVYGKDRPPGGEDDLFVSFFGILGRRMWGSLGLIDQPTLPLWVLGATSAVVLLLLVVSILPRSRLGRWAPGPAAVLALPVVLTIAVMYVGARSYYLQGRQLPGIQSRYVLTAVAGIAVCAAVGIVRLLPSRATRWLAPTALTAAVGFAAVSALQLINIMLAPSRPGRWDRLVEGTEVVVRWSPWSDWVGGLTLVVAVVTGAVAVAAFWLHAVRSPVDAKFAGD